MKWVRVILVLGILGAAAWQGALFYRAGLAAQQKPVRIPTAKVRRGDVPLTLSGYGTLEAANTVSIRNQQLESQIVEIVEDGIVVKKGQVVVRLDRTKIERQLRERRLAYEAAKTQVQKVEADSVLNVANAATRMKKAEQEQSLLLSTNRAELEQAEAQVSFDRSELEYRKRDRDRTERLAKDLLVPAADVERADLTVKAREFAVTQGERQLDVKQNSQRSAVTQGEILISDAKYAATAQENRAKEQVQNARFNAEAARRMVELLEKQLEWCEVRAPATGLTVIARDIDRFSGSPRSILRAGDPVRPSSRLLEIIDLSRMRVVADQSEMDASQTKIGQQVRVWPRSAPDQVLKGRVLSMSSLARQGDTWRRGAIPGKRTFRVVVEVLASRPDLLRPGMTADFEILQGQVSRAVHVPLQSLFETSKGRSVFIKKGPRFVARPVKTGQRNANYAVIVSGLKGGEEIALRRPPLELLGAPVKKAQKPLPLLGRALGTILRF